MKLHLYTVALLILQTKANPNIRGVELTDQAHDLIFLSDGVSSNGATPAEENEPNVHWDNDNPDTLNFFYQKTIVGDKVGPGTVIDQINKKGKYDAGFVCSIKDMTSLLKQDIHVIRIEPQVMEFENYGSVVHHMDLFACQDDPLGEFNALKDRAAQKNWCLYDEFLQTSCRQIIWAYDKGAEAFDFPNDMGILMGPSSGFNSLVMQVHYLLPEDYEPDGKGFEDASGFRLVTEPVQRPHDVGIFGLLGYDLDIPHGEEAFEYSVNLPDSELAKVISAEMKAHGKVTPVAVHLHGHNHMTGARLEHYRNGKLIGAYGKINPYHGYGPDQTFLRLEQSNNGLINLISNGSDSSEGHDVIEPLHEGDSLKLVCTFNSTMETDHIMYGVSHGDEMCALLVLYYPKERGHDAFMSDNVAEIGGWF